MPSFAARSIEGDRVGATVAKLRPDKLSHVAPVTIEFYSIVSKSNRMFVRHRARAQWIINNGNSCGLFRASEKNEIDCVARIYGIFHTPFRSPADRSTDKYEHHVTVMDFW